jgi:hypothetical protein
MPLFSRASEHTFGQPLKVRLLLCISASSLSDCCGKVAADAVTGRPHQEGIAEPLLGAFCETPGRTFARGTLEHDEAATLASLRDGKACSPNCVVCRSEFRKMDRRTTRRP